MKTNDVELPPLPTGYKSYEFPDGGYDGDEMQAYTRVAIEPYAKRIAELEAQIEAYQQGGNAKQRYNEIMKDDTEEPDPIERLRFYCSLAMSGQDWLDVEPFFDAIIADRKQHDRMLAHEWIRPALGLSEDAPYRFDFYAQEIEKLRNDSDYRQRRGEPVGYFYPWELERSLKAYPNGFPGAVAVFATAQPLSESDIPADLDSAKCAECGAEMIPVRPGKWQHPDCPQSPWAAEPVKALIDNQEPLGEEFQQVLDDNRWDLYVKTTEPVSKTDWSNELSSWDDEDFIRIFYFHPDLANRLRKVLTEPLVSDASVKVVGKPPVPSNDEIIDTAISSGLASRDSVGDVVCAWREDVDISEYLIDNARALLNRYGQQAQIDDSVFKGNSLVGEWICDADAPTPEEEAEWKRLEDAKEEKH